MDVLATFGVIAGIIFIGFVADLIFQKFGVPDVLILILVGIGLSSVLNWTDSSNYGEGAVLFTTFALVFILFQGALNLHFDTLIKSLPRTFKFTLINFFLTIGVIMLIAHFFLKYDLLSSLLTGTILAGTSSAIVIPLIHTVDINNKYGMILKLESALTDVLCILGTITILEVMKTGIFEAKGLFTSLLTSFSLAITLGLIIGFIWVYLLKEYEILTKAYMMTIAVLIALYVLVEGVGGSGAISALTFGLVMGNSKEIFLMGNKKLPEDTKHHKVSTHVKHIKTSEKTITNVLSPSAKTFYSEISFFVKTFFFVYIGTLISFSNPKIFLYGFLITIGAYLIRPLSVNLAFGKEHLGDRERAFLEVIIPKGLAAAILAGVAAQSGLLADISSEFTNLALSVIMISIIMTSILVFLAERGKFGGLYTKFQNDMKIK